MKKLQLHLRRNLRTILYIAIGLTLVTVLYIYKLGDLVDGLSQQEFAAASQAVGFHGIASNPLYLPLKILRSIVFALAPDHGQTLTRLPNVVFGIIAIGAFTWLIKLWHGQRTALLVGALFATSAWTLHVSRIATFDVLYFMAIPVLLLGYALLKKYGNKCITHYAVIAASSILLYIPGLLWIIIPTLFVERQILAKGWIVHNKWWQRTARVLLPLLLIAPLIFKLATTPSLLRSWIGLPNELASVPHTAKELVAVPVHLFIRGPQYPELWLGRVPIFDIFAVTLAIAGVYFYAKHVSTTRSRLLLAYAIIGTVLVALAGPVGLSLLVPVVFLAVAMGLTFLLHEWLKVFPSNPLPRTVGIGLICIAVVLSCTFNLRAYFVAWPHNDATSTVFQYHR